MHKQKLRIKSMRAKAVRDLQEANLREEQDKPLINPEDYDPMDPNSVEEQD